MAHRLDTVDGRARLKPRRSPYWHKLASGNHIGFRKMAATAEGTWLAQAYDSATQKQTRRSLGAFGDMPAHMRFDAAKKAAEAWFEHLGRGGSTAAVTVRKACARYVAHLREEGREAAAKDTEARFRRRVEADPIADLELSKLARPHVTEWRKRLVKAPIAKKTGGKAPARAASSVNRDMTAFRAALNLAHDDGAVTSDMAWRVTLRRIENADGRRDAYLDRKQRAALIASAEPDLALFLTAMSLVPLRPGALASLKAASFQKNLGVLTIGKDKTGGDRRIKLPPKTAAFFARQAKDKLPTAPLLTRAGGKAWDKDAWKGPVKDAAKAAGLPDTVTAYSMRHSAITDLISGGLAILTAAQLSGTSVAMIEKHYGHLRADDAASALAGLAL